MLEVTPTVHSGHQKLAKRFEAKKRLDSVYGFQFQMKYLACKTLLEIDCDCFPVQVGMKLSPGCSCGNPQSMNHVDCGLLTKFEGGLMTVHEDEEDAVD